MTQTNLFKIIAHGAFWTFCNDWPRDRANLDFPKIIKLFFNFVVENPSCGDLNMTM